MRTPSPYDFGEPVGDPVKIDNPEVLIVDDLCVNLEEDVMLLDTTTGDLVIEEPEVIWSVKTLADDVYDTEWTEESQPSSRLFGKQSHWRSSAHGKVHYTIDDMGPHNTASCYHYGDNEDATDLYFEYDVLNQEVLTQEVLKLKKEFDELTPDEDH